MNHDTNKTFDKTPPLQEAFPDNRLPGTNTTQLPPYQQTLRNGAQVCSAHEIMIKVLDKQDKKLDEMDAKLDQLMINEGIDSDKSATRDKWKDRGYGAGLTLLGLLLFELIKYLTPL